MTFLKSYKSVSVLYDHSRGTFFGSSKGSVGVQYSTKPCSSAETTVLYLALYCGSIRMWTTDKSVGVPP